MPKRPEDLRQTNLVIRIPATMHHDIRDAAQAEDLSISQLVRRAIRHELDAIGLKDSAVDHIDGDPRNNDPANLAIREPKKGKQ